MRTNLRTWRDEACYFVLVSKGGERADLLALATSASAKNALSTALAAQCDGGTRLCVVAHKQAPSPAKAVKKALELYAQD